jgi:hypothetical protein
LEDWLVVEKGGRWNPYGLVGEMLDEKDMGTGKGCGQSKCGAGKNLPLA